MIHFLQPAISGTGLEGKGVEINYLTVITHPENFTRMLQKIQTSHLGMVILTTVTATERIQCLFS